MDAPNDHNALAQTLRWVVDIDPASVIAATNQKRRAFPGESPRQLAQRIVQSYARRGAIEGFVLGLGSNPLVMVGTALGDVAIMLRFYAYLTAIVGYLANEDYFEDPDWKNDALLMLAGPKAISRAMREAGIQLGKQSTKIFIKKYLSKGVLRALKRFVLKWFGKKVTQRMILTKTIPVVGGLVGGSWNYVELRVVGSRIIQYHFDGRLSE